MKKNLGIILIISLIVIISVVIVCIKGFKVELEYAENVSITIEIGKEFDIKDIKKIADEVFKKQEVIIQKVEVYEDVVEITAKEVSEEQLEQLNSKLNEKYNLENEVSSIRVLNNANTRLRNEISHYILPLVISFATIHIYEIIRFKKIGILNVLYTAVFPIIISQLLLACIYAICRIPIGKEDIIVSLALYIGMEMKGIKELIKKLEIKEEKRNKKNEPVKA